MKICEGAQKCSVLLLPLLQIFPTLLHPNKIVSQVQTHVWDCHLPISFHFISGGVSASCPLHLIWGFCSPLFLQCPLLCSLHLSSLRLSESSQFRAIPGAFGGPFPQLPWSPSLLFQPGGLGCQVWMPLSSTGFKDARKGAQKWQMKGLRMPSLAQGGAGWGSSKVLRDPRTRVPPRHAGLEGRVGGCISEAPEEVRGRGSWINWQSGCQQHACDALVTSHLGRGMKGGRRACQAGGEEACGAPLSLLSSLLGFSRSLSVLLCPSWAPLCCLSFLSCFWFGFSDSWSVSLTLCVSVFLGVKSQGSNTVLWEAALESQPCLWPL